MLKILPGRFAIACLLLWRSAWAQTPPNPTEVSSQDAPLTFQSKVNLVLVPVVVLDRAGNPVGTLRREDFQLLDKGKAQAITKFSVEKSGGKPIPITKVERAPDEKAPPEGDGVLPPEHFVAFLFDDVHLAFGDLVYVRDAAIRHVQTLAPTDRAAVYTTSGRTTQDFTDNREQLMQALKAIQPHPIARIGLQQCPDISYYMADLIQNKNDTIALNIAALEAMVCANLPDIGSATAMAQGEAARVMAGGDQETRVSMLVMKELVRRMAGMPGQRVIVMVSPGFLRLDQHLQDETDIIDRAIRANVTINALDARGLYTGAPDISKRTFSPQIEIAKQQYDRAANSAAADVMAEVAAGTGGTFFQNSNDLGKGMGQLAASPSVYYVLGFSPQNLKLDGSYHSLKISVKPPAGLTVKARRGYYAPRHLTDADEEAKEEISQALFSRDEIHDIPVEMHTQFFKASESEARLVVISRLDVRKLHYRRAADRNANEVMIVSGLFDRNGNYLQGVSKLMKMNLKDETLAGKLGNGVMVRSEFKVAPGTYVIRLVVRDAEGQTMAAQNGAVEIP